MTLVLAVTGKKSIWMLTDRRLSSTHCLPKDDARKMMRLKTTDGNALLGYAGLGSTGLGTESSDWMARTLRGYNLPLEQSLGVLIDAVRVRLPNHLETIQNINARDHCIIIPAFLNGEPRLYSIELIRSRNRREYLLRPRRNERQVTSKKSSKEQLPPRIAVGGSGRFHLPKNRQWMRDLMRMVAAYDEGRVSVQAVYSAFARLNHLVAKLDRGVSQRCIIASAYMHGGGEHAFFNGIEQEESPVFIPMIDCGHPVSDVAPILLHFFKSAFDLDAMMRGEKRELDLDLEGLKAALAKLPDDPDDTLP